MSVPSYPLFRADLNHITSPKLDIDETLYFEHPDDDNYARNRIYNLSVSVVKNAKLNRKTCAWPLSDLSTVDAIVEGLKANFPDCQVKLYPPTEKEPRNVVRMFWS
jgi:hypothetical protein